jgi:2-oxoglutarate ferredoxin oxidoreductase subunit alpha
MFEKRQRKMQTYLREDVKPPVVSGSPDGVPLLVGWGSTKLPILDAQARLRAEGMETCAIHFTHLWPFPVHLVRPLLQRGSHVIVIEMNFSGQLADLIQQECLIETRRVLKYTGKPYYTSDIVAAVRQIHANGTKVLRLGTPTPTPVLEMVPEGDD